MKSFPRLLPGICVLSENEMLFSSSLLLVPAPKKLCSLLQSSVNILSRGFCCSIHPFAIHLAILHMLIYKCKPIDF